MNNRWLSISFQQKNMTCIIMRIQILSFSSKPFMLLSQLLFLSLILLNTSISGATENNYPQYHINISFNMEQSTLHATSSITLPPGKAITLKTGSLHITGMLLVINNSNPLTLTVPSNNIITLPAIPTSQTLLISWSLPVTPENSDNLISKQGITLAGFWHPIPDQDMLYSLQAELPVGFSGVTEADTLSLQNTGSRQLMHSNFKYSLRTINFIAGPYHIHSKKIDQHTTIYTYFFAEDSELAQSYLNKGADYLKRYSEMIGQYPYKRFSIVENRLPTGYAMPTFTLLGQAIVRLPFILDTSLGHEILHSWFGNSIFPEDGENWLEGLTTYLADQLNAADKGAGTQYRKGQLQRYQSYVPLDNDMTLASFNNPDNSQPMSRKIRTIGYDKGSMLFHMLNKELGEDHFLAGLRLFFQKMKFKRASWDDIEKIFSTISQKDLQPFFSQWLQRSDLPILEITKAKNEQINGITQLSFHLLQKSQEAYQLIIPITINTISGSFAKTIKTYTHDDLFEIQVDELVTDISIDQDYDLMRSLNPAEIIPSWSLFDGATDKVIVLPENDSDASYQPFIDYFENLNTKIITTDKLRNSELMTNNYLFLGPSHHSKSLFATQNTPENSCTVDVRINPLNPEKVIVLLSSNSIKASTTTISKLRHYGKYSYLKVTNGRVLEKKTSPTINGIRIKTMGKPRGLPTKNILSFTDVIDDLAQSKVIYVGENHTDYGSHLLQLQIIQALYQRHPELAIGMEMFPRSSQPALDDYINNQSTSEREFIKKSKYFSVWGYDYRFYKAIIDFARKNKIPIIGLNLEKKIVRNVFRSGNTDELDELSNDAIAMERELDLPGYRNRLKKIHLLHENPHQTKDSFSGFLQSQALWDETMAETISKYLKDQPEKKMIVLAGAGHVHKDNAIPPRVKRRLNIDQSVVLGIHAYDNSDDNSSQFDYLMDIPFIEGKTAGKLGLVLKNEPNKNDAISTQVRIVQVSHHGKAGQAGVQKNDIILSIEDQPVKDIEDLKITLMYNNPGDSVKVKILRENQIMPDEILELNVVLSDFSTSITMPPAHPK